MGVDDVCVKIQNIIGGIGNYNSTLMIRDG